MSKKKEIKYYDFDKVEKYLHDDYLEYFIELKETFFQVNLKNIYKYIIDNEQPRFLIFMLEKYPLPQYDLTYCLQKYIGKNYPKEILEVLLEKYPNFTSALTTDNYFNYILKNSSLEYIKEIYKLRQKSNIPNLKLNLGNYFSANFSDMNIFYWLIDEKIINLNTDLVQWLIHELSYNYITKDNLDYLLEKIKFDKNKLKEIFNFKSGYSYKYIFPKLISNKNNDLIYYFFELLEPKFIIKKEGVNHIIQNIIEYADYEMFMFLLKHIKKLQYDDSFDNNHSKNSYANHFRTRRNYDFNIAYELIKLGIKLDKYSKEFNNLVIKK